MYSLGKIGVLALGFMLYACATTPQLSQQEINEQYPALTKLESQLENARVSQVDLLAPQGFTQAVEQYDTAKVAASRKEDKETIGAVEAGMAALQSAQEEANVSKNVFADVINAREQAKQAGAEQMYGDQLSALDAKFGEASSLIKEGQLEKAKQRRAELQRAYSNLQLSALKQGTTRRAEAALAQAKNDDADKLAPKSFAQAQEELQLAKSILEIDRTDIDNANSHAKRATDLSLRSKNIAEVVKEFDRRDFSKEDIVLWYQNELATVASPLGERLTFNEPNDMTVNSLHQRIGDVVKDKNENQQKADTLGAKLAQLDSMRQQEITQLKQQHDQELAGLNSQFRSQISKQEITRADMAAMEVARESKFSRVQDMFKDNEAKVYRQKDNVLLSVYGFDFPSGTADIKADNFALMDKIIKSISEFKTPNVIVTGHTDATGTAEVNKSLSEQRAQNVAKFLNEVGGIPKERIVAEGYGQSKPVASNQTSEGRALNRRVEILIVNK